MTLCLSKYHNHQLDIILRLDTYVTGAAVYFFQDDVMLFNVIKIRKHTNDAITFTLCSDRQWVLIYQGHFILTDCRDKLANNYFS